MIIEIKDLTKKYEKKTVLNIKDATLNLNGSTGIIGPNGAGKSTLVNILAGLIDPTTGLITYDGSSVIPKKDMTLVFQKPYLISGSVEMNIRYPLRLRSWSSEKIKARTDFLLEELGLTTLRSQKTWKLSGGETQKVALARALSFQPKLLILDEPTANIDPGTTAEIEKMLKKVSLEADVKIIIITHNLVQAKRVCDNIIFMNKGAIIEQGATDQILHAPLHQETEKFISGELLF